MPWKLQTKLPGITGLPSTLPCPRLTSFDFVLDPCNTQLYMWVLAMLQWNVRIEKKVWAAGLHSSQPRYVQLQDFTSLAFSVTCPLQPTSSSLSLGFLHLHPFTCSISYLFLALDLYLSLVPPQIKSWLLLSLKCQHWKICLPYATQILVVLCLFQIITWRCCRLFILKTQEVSGYLS